MKILEKRKQDHLILYVIQRKSEAFLTEQCKEIEENNTMGKTRDLFKKIGDIKIVPIFIQKWAQ